ncbi:MAG TPA: CopG family transcriptional regulator, partial [Thermoanaerobaculia bacterium]|nr:CopG family transcriptional regulator [Thermoanaerobaculia bacterium]
MIEEEVDAALEKEARSKGISKAALIRRLVGSHLKPLPSPQADPLWKMAG